VLQEVALPGTGADPARFLDAAVRFANERCWGTLSCSLMVRAQSPARCARAQHSDPEGSAWGARVLWLGVGNHALGPGCELQQYGAGCSAASNAGRLSCSRPGAGRHAAGRAPWSLKEPRKDAGRGRARAQVSPDVLEQHAGAVDAAVAGLRYGSVNVNVASMLGFCVPRLTWGAFPGNPVQARPRLHMLMLTSTSMLSFCVPRLTWGASPGQPCAGVAAAAPVL